MSARGPAVASMRAATTSGVAVADDSRMAHPEAGGRGRLSTSRMSTALVHDDRAPQVLAPTAPSTRSFRWDAVGGGGDYVGG